MHRSPAVHILRKKTGLCRLSIATQKPKLHGPPAYYTSDGDAAKQSVENLATLNPLTVAAGHGHPISGPDVANALQILAERFDEFARPHKGKRAA